jgi:cellulose synthase operon protein YhjQ
MSVIGVVSMKGGVGKTSVTANLGVAMAEALGHGRVSVVDLDPQNALRLHLGIESDDAPGVCTQSIAAADWIDIAIDSAHGVRCLPYGEVSESERLNFEEILHRGPHWVGENIHAAGLDDDAIVLIDTPPGSSVYLRQTFACADLIVIVLLADAASYSTVTAMESWMQELQDMFPHVPHLYLINQIDRTDLLNKDVSDVLQQRLGEALSPIGIHMDESVREALAFQQPVLAYDPHGQASHDMARLADFLIDVLNQ